MIDHARQESTIVAYDEKSLVAAFNEAFQPVDGIEVEMIGWLVEQEYLRSADQLSGKPETTELSSAQLSDLACARSVGIKPKTVQDRVDARGELIATLTLKSLEIAIIPGQNFRR